MNLRDFFEARLMGATVLENQVLLGFDNGKGLVVHVHGDHLHLYGHTRPILPNTKLHKIYLPCRAHFSDETLPMYEPLAPPSLRGRNN